MFLSRTRQIIGLEIGSHAIKMVALRPAKGELPFELTHVGVAELPEETIVDGAIVDEDPVARTIAELFEQHKVKSPFVAASVSGNAVIVRRVTMPRRDPEELREALPFEAEDRIPFDIDDVDLDFAILSEDEEAGNMDVVLVAAKRERVDEHVAVIEISGDEIIFEQEIEDLLGARSTRRVTKRMTSNQEYRP
jgi:type IV pilus assembly protein PilM